MAENFKVAIAWTQNFAGHVVISAETLEEAKEKAPTLFNTGGWPAFKPAPIDPEADPAETPPPVGWEDLVVTSVVSEDDFSVDDDKTTELNAD